MTIQTTRWSPDTCGCVLEYNWDDAVPEEERVHTGAKIIQRCPAHSSNHFNDNHDHYSTVLEENQRKNRSITHFMELFPEHTEIIPQEKQSALTQMVSSVEELSATSEDELLLTQDELPRRLKPHIKFLFGWTGEGKDRVLHVKFHGAKLPANKKKEFKETFNRKLGHQKFNVV